jgi:RNA-directed DNA polymerase
VTDIVFNEDCEVTCGSSGDVKLIECSGVKRQLVRDAAKSAHGPWRLSASPALYTALPNKYFKNLGYQSW